jgi:hypothetical protein
MNMNKIKRNTLIITIIYLLIILLYLSKFGFNPTATIQLSSDYQNVVNIKIPDNIIRFNHIGFDGQYYYLMAVHQDLKDFKISPHFLQRIILPMLVSAFSFNNYFFAAILIILINLFAIVLSSYIFMLLLKKYKANLDLVFLFAFNITFIIGILKNLTEPLMILFVILSIYYFDREKHINATIFLSIAFLTRELAIIVYGAFLLYFIVKKDFKKMLLYSTAIIPFLLWNWYLMYILSMNKLPMIISYYSIAKPFLGFFNYFYDIPMDIMSIQGSIQESSKSIFPFLQQIDKKFSSIPILIFGLIQLIFLIRIFFKDKMISFFQLTTLVSCLFIFATNKAIYSIHGIDAIGRYAAFLFIFSILFFSEKKEKYPIVLAIISMTLSLIYLLVILFVKGGYV